MSSQDEMRREVRMRGNAFGLSSNEISLKRDHFSARFGGGSMAKCIQNEYERDYIIEAKLND